MKFGAKGVICAIFGIIFSAVFSIGIGIITAYYVWWAKRKQKKKDQRRE